MVKITSLNTGEDIKLPDWENGFSKKEYELLVRGLKQACDSDIDNFNSKLTSSVDDIVGNLPLFGIGVFYEQAYKNIFKHNELKPEPHIADVAEADSPDEHLMYKAGEVLARDIEGRILRERST